MCGIHRRKSTCSLANGRHAVDLARCKAPKQCEATKARMQGSMEMFLSWHVVSLTE